MHILTAIVFMLAVAHSVYMVMRFIATTTGTIATGPTRMYFRVPALINGLLWAIFYYCSSY